MMFVRDFGSRFIGVAAAADLETPVP